MTQIKDTVFPHPDVAFGRFQRALRRVMRVSKSELKATLAAEEGAKAGKPRPGPRRKIGQGAKTST